MISSLQQYKVAQNLVSTEQGQGNEVCLPFPVGAVARAFGLGEVAPCRALSVSLLARSYKPGSSTSKSVASVSRSAVSVLPVAGSCSTAGRQYSIH